VRTVTKHGVPTWHRVNINRELLWITVAVAIAVAIAMIVGWSIGLIRVLAQPQAQAQGNVTVIYVKLS
jgi:type III secretory pathway component EscS